MIEVFNEIKSSKKLKRFIEEEDFSYICEWVIKFKDEPRGLNFDFKTLTTSVLKQWFLESDFFAISRFKKKIIGFCLIKQSTLSDLRKNEMEVFYVCVKENFQTKYYASNMLLSLIEEIKKKNYSRLIGGVNEANYIAKALLEHLNWSNSSRLPKIDQLDWYEFSFQKELRVNNFFQERMRQLKINSEELADLVGVSKQYINGLKNPMVGRTEKHPSSRLMRELALILSQPNRKNFDTYFSFKQIEKENFIQGLTESDNKKKLIEDWLRMWPKMWSFRSFSFNKLNDKTSQLLKTNANPQHIFNFLTIVNDITDLSKHVIYANNTTSQDETKKRFKEIEIRGSIKNVEDTYEIWTLSDIFNEQVNLESAENVARDILYGRVIHRFFGPQAENAHWKLAKTNIENALIKVYNSDSSLAKIWNEPFGEKVIRNENYQKNPNKLNIDGYLSFYGVPEALLFFRVRIYDAKGSIPKASTNIGGLTPGNTLFVDLGGDIVEKIKGFVSLIMVAEQTWYNTKIIPQSSEIDYYGNPILPVDDKIFKIARKYPPKGVPPIT